MAQAKIAVHSLPDLKNTTDDALPNYLSSLKFAQDHHYTDVRLALGYAAVAIAGVLFYFDWTLGWDATRRYTAPAVAVYFLLNSAFTYWIWAVEKGIVFAGERDGTRLVLSSRTEKHSPVYHLTARWRRQAGGGGSSSSGQWEEKSISAEFSRWFTADGFFVAKPFQQFLASEVPAVGAADPDNVVEDIGRGSGAGPASASASGIDVASLSAGQLDQVLNSMSGAKTKAGAKARRKA